MVCSTVIYELIIAALARGASRWVSRDRLLKILHLSVPFSENKQQIILHISVHIIITSWLLKQES